MYLPEIYTCLQKLEIKMGRGKKIRNEFKSVYRSVVAFQSKNF